MERDRKGHCWRTRQERNYVTCCKYWMLCTYPELLGRYRIQVVCFTARNRLSSTRAARSAALAVLPYLMLPCLKGGETASNGVCGRPQVGQARIQNRVGGSLVRYCRMSGLLMQPLLAAGPYGVREIRSKSGMRARRPSAISWFFRPRLVDRLPLPVPYVLLPTCPGSFSALASLLSLAGQAAVRSR